MKTYIASYQTEKGEKISARIKAINDGVALRRAQRLKFLLKLRGTNLSLFWFIQPAELVEIL